MLLNSYFCIGYAKDNSTSAQQDSQNNLGKQFADEYEKNGKEIAQGIGKGLHLSPEATKVLQETLVFLGRTIAYIVGALARGQSHVSVDPNSSQADRNGKIAAVIGRRIGEELTDIPGLNIILNDQEKEAVPDLNSLIAVLIARFFGTLGDIGEAIRNKSPQDGFEAVLKYFNVDNY